MLFFIQSKSELSTGVIDNIPNLIDNMHRVMHNFMFTKSDSNAKLDYLICQVKFDEYI